MMLSRVPAAVVALVEILQAATDPATIAVIDGPLPGNGALPIDMLFVGWQPGADAAVDLQQEFAGAGARNRDEDISILGYIETRSGDRDMKARRARVFEIFGLIETALRATDAEPEAPTLRGAVLWANVTAGALVQDQTTDGAQAGLHYTVTCRARI
jgi:hypothetical protein